MNIISGVSVCCVSVCCVANARQHSRTHDFCSPVYGLPCHALASKSHNTNKCAFGQCDGMTNRRAMRMKKRETRKMCLVLCIKLAPSEPFHMRMDGCEYASVRNESYQYMFMRGAWNFLYFFGTKASTNRFSTISFSFVCSSLCFFASVQLKCYAMIIRFH